MYLMLQVTTVFLVSVAMALALAHALELPGKLRLGKAEYIAVQPIYYPGFTLGGGIGEGLGMVATAVLLILTPAGTAAFWWTLAGFLALGAMHAAYWIVTHPVNTFWLKEQDLSAVGGGFFGFDPLNRGMSPGANAGDPWIRARDRWEWSHVLRAVLGAIALIALIIAVAI